MRYLLFSFVALYFFPNASLAATRLPVSENFIPTQNEFASAMVMVPKTHQVLYAFKQNKPHPAASLTKLAGALVLTRLEMPWSAWIKIKNVDEVGGGRLRVKTDSGVRMRDLLISSIAGSANNAAMALARVTGLSKKKFLSRMNAEAKRAGAKSSHFIDASGMGVENTTTALDVCLIAEKAFRDPLIHQAATAGLHKFFVRKPNHWKIVRNTNKLLTDDENIWIVGGKTGYLVESKYNFVVQLRPFDEQGISIKKQELIIAVLGAPAKDASFNSAKRLAEWTWKNHRF